MTPTEMFYADDVFVEEIDFSRPSGDAHAPLQHDVVSFSGSLLSTITAVAMFGVLSIGGGWPSSWTSPPIDAQALVRARVPDVSIPPAHLQAAARFGRLFRPVPLSSVEKLPDPDYGL